MRSSLVAATFAAALTLTTAAPAVAADICWDALAPQTGGEWNTASNWAGGVLPGPGDTAVLDSDDPTCSSPDVIVLSGASASVGFVRQGQAKLLIDGDAQDIGLTLGAGAPGVENPTQFLGDVDIQDGGSLTIAADSEIRAGGTMTLGDPGNGSIFIAGTLRTVTSQFDVLEPSGGGLVSIAPGGSLVYGAGSGGTLRSRLDNDGTIELQEGVIPGGTFGASLVIHGSSGTPESEGAFTISALSTLALRPARGSLMAISGSVTGAGKLEVSKSEGFPGGVGTVALHASASLDVGRLTIGSPSTLELAASGTTGELVLEATDAEGDGRRTGAGTLTASTATIAGGQIADGVTKITGRAEITGGSTTPQVHNGATLLTEGLTAWQGGAVTLGAAGEPVADATWQNAGTLVVSGAPQLLAGSGEGVLRNVAGAAISRVAPAGEMTATARIVNAGTVNLLAGTIGLPAALATGAFEQDAGGVTTLAADTTLAMNATLAGGVLRGSGTVRSLANSGGLVEPGASPGVLTIVEDFTQGPDGTLLQEIAGPAAGQFDRLVVGGHAALDGTLAIVSAPDYAPARLSSYEVVKSVSLSGRFAQITGAQSGVSSYAAGYLSDAAQLCFYCGPLNSLEMTVTLSGAGSGSVTSDLAGIGCEADCSEDYPPGTTVTLTAQPAGGSVFVGWSGICAGLGPCVVTMSEARNITATFAPAPPPDPVAAAVAARPAPTAAPPRKQMADIVVFPSAGKCISIRLLRIRLRVPRGVTAKNARILVNGKQIKVVRGSRLSKPVDLRRLPKGRVKVEIVISLADGRTVRESRTYRTCASKRR